MFIDVCLCKQIFHMHFKNLPDSQRQPYPIDSYLCARRFSHFLCVDLFAANNIFRFRVVVAPSVATAGKANAVHIISTAKCKQKPAKRGWGSTIGDEVAKNCENDLSWMGFLFHHSIVNLSIQISLKYQSKIFCNFVCQYCKEK